MAEQGDLTYRLQILAQGVVEATAALVKIKDVLDSLPESKTIRVRVEGAGRLEQMPSAATLNRAALQSDAAERARSEKVGWDAYQREKRAQGKAWEDEQRSEARAYKSAHRSDVAFEREQQKSARAYHREQTELTKSTKHATTAMERFWDAVGMGQWRRGVGGLVTETLGGGAIASLVGGMAGAIASSIALPIGWAVGNAVMQLPQFAAERVGWKRYVESIPARGGADKLGGDWLKKTEELSQFFTHLAGPKGDYLSKQITATMLHYQAVGARAGDPKAAARASQVATLLELADIEPERLGLAGTLKMLATGTPKERRGALSQLAEKPYARPALIQAMIREKGLEEHPYKDIIAEQLVDARLAITPGVMGAYTEKDFAIALGRAAMESRVLGEMQKQRGETWYFGPEGMVRELNFDQAGRLPSHERWYVDEIERIERARAAGENVKTPKQDRISGRQQEWDPLELRARYRGKMMAGREGPGAFDPVPAERILELERIGKAMAGNKEALAAMTGAQGEISPMNFMPSRFQFTSFTGLAENMQQMWGAFPVGEATEQNTAATNKLTAAVDRNSDLLASIGIGFGGEAIPTFQGDILPGGEGMA